MWRVMERFLKVSASDEEKGSADHATLVKTAVRSGVAVWDVLAEVHAPRGTKRAKRAAGVAGAVFKPPVKNHGQIFCGPVCDRSEASLCPASFGIAFWQDSIELLPRHDRSGTARQTCS